MLPIVGKLRLKNSSLKIYYRLIFMSWKDIWLVETHKHDAFP